MRAAEGMPIHPFCDRYPGLLELLAERCQYVQEWVRVFYATLFVGEDWKYIIFMFNKKQWRLNRQSLARYLGVTLSDEPYSLHFNTYGDADPFFHTLLQESFYFGYLQLGIQMSEHRMLHWGALRVTAGGVPIQPFFERFPGLPALLAERRQYVQEWVHVFYATLFVGEDRKYIMFMFNKMQYRLNR